MAAPAYHHSTTEGPAKCTWKPNSHENDPHRHVQAKFTQPKIMESILENIGRTPLVRVNKIGKEDGVNCQILAKCEFFNSGGSVKDRIGLRMVEDAELSGRIKKGDILIEPTSGNTGIGLALAAALKGYKMIITLPEKMSQEKVSVLKALGAEIIRTPTEAAFDAPESHIGVAKRLNHELPHSHILDQYSNPSNPLAHYDGTAEELLHQTNNKIDVVVLSAGTGGTVTGIARKIKERLPNCKIVGVDPYGSILAQPESLNGPMFSYKVEGIGYDFIPKVLERSLVDLWIKTYDRESFVMARRLIREEGMLCGGSAGATMHAAMIAAKHYQLGPQHNMVVLLADSIRNYMSKHLNDDWMRVNGFTDSTSATESHQHEWWAKKTVADLRLHAPVTVLPSCSCHDAAQILKSQGIDQIPVVAENGGDVLGMVTEGNLLSQMLSKRVTGHDSVAKVLYRQFQQITLDTPLAKLHKIFDNDHFALVVSTQKCYSSASQVSVKSIVCGIVTRIDLLNFILHGQQN